MNKLELARNTIFDCWSCDNHSILWERLGALLGARRPPVKNDAFIALWIHDSLPQGWYPIHSYER